MDVANPQMDCESAFIVRDVPLCVCFVCNKSCFHFFVCVYILRISPISETLARVRVFAPFSQKNWYTLGIKTEHIWSIKDFSI